MFCLEVGRISRDQHASIGQNHQHEGLHVASDGGIAWSQKLTICQGQGRYIRPGHPDFYVDERPPNHVGSDDEDSDFGPPQGAADDEEPGTPQSERSS